MVTRGRSYRGSATLKYRLRFSQVQNPLLCDMHLQRQIIHNETETQSSQILGDILNLGILSPFSDLTYPFIFFLSSFTHMAQSRYAKVIYNSCLSNLKFFKSKRVTRLQKHLINCTNQQLNIIV